MKHDPLNNIARKTERYWFQDGIWEIGFGLVNLLLAAFYLIVSQGDWQGPRALALLAMQFGVIIGGFLGINWVVKALKERITYPRTGFVAYRRRPISSRLRRMLLSAAVAGGTAALMGVAAALQGSSNPMPLIAGVVFAAALAVMGYRFRLSRMYLLAVLSILLGAAISAARLPETLMTAAFFGGYALMMIFSGTVVLILYLRGTRPASPDADYEAPSTDEKPSIDSETGIHGRMP